MWGAVIVIAILAVLLTPVIISIAAVIKLGNTNRELRHLNNEYSWIKRELAELRRQNNANPPIIPTAPTNTATSGSDASEPEATDKQKVPVSDGGVANTTDNISGASVTPVTENPTAQFGAVGGFAATPPSGFVSPTPTSPRAVPSAYAKDGSLTENVGYTDNNSGKKPSYKKDSRSVEGWIGRNLIGIAAAALIFIGMIFLGILVYEDITDDIKIILMFLISGALFVPGLVLTLKKRNSFTLILMGCGCGALFISILLTHIYFDRINDITAFSLLLVWLAGVFVSAKFTNSVLLSVVAHIGMAVSLGFAYAQGLSDDKLLLLLIYQTAATVIVVLGSRFACKRTVNLSIAISLCLTVFCGGLMCAEFADVSFLSQRMFQSTLPPAAIITAFAVQFIGSAVLAYLLSLSLSRAARKCDDEGSSAAGAWWHIFYVAGKLVFFTSMIFNVYMPVFHIYGYSAVRILNESIGTTEIDYAAMTCGLIVTLFILACNVILTTLASSRLNFKRSFEKTSVLSCFAFAGILLFAHYNNAFYNIGIEWYNLPYLIIAALLLFGMRHITKIKEYSVGGYVLLALDYLTMLFSGFFKLYQATNIIVPICYLLIYVVLLFALNLSADTEVAKKFNPAARIVALFGFEAGLYSILSSWEYNYNIHIIFIVLVSVAACLYIFGYDRGKGKSKVVHYALCVNEVFLVMASCIFLCSEHSSKMYLADIIYLLILTVATLALAFPRISDTVRYSRDEKTRSYGTLLSVWTGIKLTAITLCSIHGCTVWFDEAYIFSIVCMITALVCVIGGFLLKLKGMRFYGLILTLFCVLKLVSVDVGELETPLRVVSLIAGGIICFIISAIYNYTVKKIQ